MKQLHTHIAFFLFFAGAVNAQTVSQTHMAFLTTKTATWCNPCGTWAWPLQEDIVADNESKAVCVELHYSSSDVIHNTTATDLQDNFPYVSSTPAWYLNGLNQTVYSQNGGIYTTLTQAALNAAADSTYDVLPVVQSAYISTLSGSNLTVNTSTKFFNAASGEYYIAAYIMEDNVIAYQNGIGNNAQHQNVLRTSMSSSTFGELVASGSIAANSIYNKTFTYTIDNSWHADKIWLATVIWKKTGGTYVYENAFTTNAKITGINDPGEQGMAFSVFPNPSFETSQLSIALTSPIQNLDISLVDLTGRQLIGVYDGALQPGDYKFTVNTKDLAPGLYFLSLISDGKSYAEKVIVAK